MSESQPDDASPLETHHRMGFLGWSIFGTLLAALSTAILVLNPLGQDEDCCFPINEMWNPDHLLSHGWVKADDPKRRGLLTHFTIPMQRDRWYQKTNKSPVWVEIQQSNNIMKATQIPNEMNVGIAWEAPHIRFKESQLRADADKLDQELCQWWKEYVATHTDKAKAAPGTKASGKQLPVK
jgi:hypothetical protein